MVGFDIEGNVKNYTVLKHAETPGLGAKMQEWFSNTSKPSQSVIDRKWSENMKVTKDGGDVDAITAATITSRAFMDALNRAYEAFVKATEAEANSQTEELATEEISTEESATEELTTE
jgi:electron transport complex protein RnfG